MTKLGLDAARHHGELLPRFASLSEAQDALFSHRDRLLADLCAAATRIKRFTCDYSADSLKSLELWYFHLLESEGFVAAGLTREVMEQAISIYLGQVFAV